MGWGGDNLHGLEFSAAMGVAGYGGAKLLGMALRATPEGGGLSLAVSIVNTVSCYAAWLVAFRTSILLRSEAVVIENVFVRLTIPWRQGRQFYIQNGLRVRLLDGRTYGVWAFQGPLGGGAHRLCRIQADRGQAPSRMRPDRVGKRAGVSATADVLANPVPRLVDPTDGRGGDRSRRMAHVRRHPNPNEQTSW